MHYYIDGYNLIFRLSGGGDQSLQIQRQQLINELNEKAQVLNLSMTLVFDSPTQKKEVNRSHYQNLEIIYTAEGETADDYILSSLKHCKSPKKETIITSDKFLSWQARRYGAKTESVEEFIPWLVQRYENKLRPKPPPKAPEKIKPSTQEPPLKVSKPAESTPPKQAVEGSFDFYLKIFEEKHQQWIDKEGTLSKQVKKIKPSRFKKPQKGKLTLKDPLLESDRWLKIFEERVGKEEDEPF